MMRMFNIFLMLIFLLLVVTYGDKTEYIIEVNADKQGVQISPILYGLFLRISIMRLTEEYMQT